MHWYTFDAPGNPAVCRWLMFPVDGGGGDSIGCLFCLHSSVRACLRLALRHFLPPSRPVIDAQPQAGGTSTGSTALCSPPTSPRCLEVGWRGQLAEDQVSLESRLLETSPRSLGQAWARQGVAEREVVAVAAAAWPGWVVTSMCTRWWPWSRTWTSLCFEPGEILGGIR